VADSWLADVPSQFYYLGLSSLNNYINGLHFFGQWSTEEDHLFGFIQRDSLFFLGGSLLVYGLPRLLDAALVDSSIFSFFVMHFFFFS
jgi:hypothetical protein